MSNRTIALRAATQTDDAALARLVNYAGEGLPLFFWRRVAAEAAPGEPTDAWEIGRQRARRETGSFSYRHATIAEQGGRILGVLIDYRIADAPEPTPPGAVPPIFEPIQALEDRAPGTHYVSVLAVEPGDRGKGVGGRLLRAAERAADGRTLSIIVSDANHGARRLYERFGFREAARAAMIKEDWENPGENWVLLLKPASDAG